MDGNGRIVAGGGEVTIEVMDQYDRLEIGARPMSLPAGCFRIRNCANSSKPKRWNCWPPVTLHSRQPAGCL